MAALTARAAAGSTSTGACFSFAASTLPASTRWRGTTSSCAAAALSSRAFRTERGQFSAPLFSPHRLPAAPATGGLARFAMSSAQGARPDGNGVSRMIVVGGGPAGFMCAVEAARAARAAGTPLEVIILEATSKVLGKVKISGGGRCNVLHDETKGAKLISEG
ncbi:hypothetical protein T484DRAFT_1831322 [Baffinella frigidus]|nr:hypothetical protein T484DRAFT_1831322 [Cryptophyta sp. CCMP2293]